MGEQEIELEQENIIVHSGGGAVNSVNGYTGDVVLTTSDLENTSDYQTGTEVESAISAAVAGKQDTLTAGNNITISNNTISATDTTYSAGTGLDLTGTTFSVDTATIATQQDVSNEATAREDADTNLQGQIDAISASSDVKDIVGTKAELNNYDTSTLGNNDIIKVLQDESENDATTYYRWNATTQQFALIGEEGPYYTKAATDTLLDAKQDVLTAGANVQISGSNVISATDTTYADFTGTDGTTAGTSGLVPAPATTDAGKFLKADGTWDTAGGGSGPTVVQTTGTSTTDVMSQNAVTSMVFADPGTNRKVQIGDGATATGTSSVAVGPKAPSGTDAPMATQIGAVAIGAYAQASGGYSVAFAGKASASGAIAIGWGSQATAKGQFDIGTQNTGYGYNNTLYRLISGLYDGQSAHDAATYGQLISYAAINGAGAPTTATEGRYVGQLYYDTTNEAMYFLKTIDTTTTPTTYTWEALGGGGSITPVQVPGDSTTDVMSQNAVTSMVFADPATMTKIKIGAGTSTSEGNDGIEIGHNAKATAINTTALGVSASANGARSTAVGQASTVQSDNSLAIGSGFVRINSPYSVAIGVAEVKTGAQGAVAIGDRALATMKGQFDISTLGDGATSTRGYNNSPYRLLTGVYDGQNAHDAATVGQITPTTDSSAPTSATVGRLGEIRIDTTTNTAYMCVLSDSTTPAYEWKSITT